MNAAVHDRDTWIITLIGFLTIIAFLKYPLYVLLLAIFAVTFLLTLLRPFWGLCLIILSHIVILSANPEITIVEIGAGAFIGWMGLMTVFHSWIVKEEHLLQSSLDWFLFSFLLYAFLSVFISWNYGAKLSDWFREFIPISFYVIYFISRKFITSYKRLKTIWVMLIIVSIYHMIYQFYFYYTRLQDVQKFWEIFAARIAGLEIIFTAGLIYTVIFFCYSPSLKTKGIYSVLAAGYTAALIATFTRSFWVLAIVGMFIVFFMIPIRPKIRFVTFSFISVALVAAIGLIFFNDLFTALLTSVLERFTSSAQATRDISFMTRFDEAAVALNHVYANPILGYGLGSTFRYYGEVFQTYREPTYIHIAFVYFLFKFGIFGSFFYVAFFMQALFGALTSWYHSQNEFEKKLFLGFAVMMLLFIPASMTDLKILRKAGVLFISIFAAVVENKKSGVLSESH